MSSPEHKKFVWNLIKKIKVGMLVTEDQDDNESFRARPMHLIQDNYDGTLYFFTSKKASKVYEVKDGQKEVCITFADSNDQVYVSMSGKASINSDRKMIEHYWNPMANAWFEGGKEDPNIVLLEIKIYKGEHWRTEDNKLVQFFELAKSQLTDETPNIGENEKFSSNS